MILLPRHHVTFAPIDPLGDGLGEDIAAERREAGAIDDLTEPIDPQHLAQSWGSLLEEVKSDPDWFDFASD